MSLRLKLNLLIAVVVAIFTLTLLSMQVIGTRRSVNEEIEAANRVATQLLSRITFIYANGGAPLLADFLQRLGRVRATDIRLVTHTGEVLYRSPPSPYKAGRSAPDWYAGLILPQARNQVIRLSDESTLIVEADATRAVLDGWDDALQLLVTAGVAMVLGNALTFWFLGRALRPFDTIVRGLEQMRAGDFHTRLPALPGREATLMAQAFNRMAHAIEENLHARQEAAQAQVRLEQSRELTHFIQTRIEEERREIARELHDEMGQAVTAIKSLGLSVQRRCEGHDETSREAAGLIVSTASHLYEVMHGIIPRLRPLALDNLGLQDALEDLVGEWRRHHPALRFSLTLTELPDTPGDSLKLAAYRIVQEAVTNAIKHAHARRIAIRIDGQPGALAIEVSDDGCGPAEGWSDKPGHHGVRGMCERAQALGGELVLQHGEHGGARVHARLPLD